MSATPNSTFSPSANEANLRVCLITTLCVITTAVVITGVALWVIGATSTLPQLTLAGLVITSISVGPIALALLAMLTLALICSPCLFACACANRNNRAL